MRTVVFNTGALQKNLRGLYFPCSSAEGQGCLVETQKSTVCFCRPEGMQVSGLIGVAMSHHSEFGPVCGFKQSGLRFNA